MEKYLIPREEDFRSEINGKTTELICLKNNDGMMVFLTNYGARIVSIFVKDAHNNWVDVNIGHQNINEYTRQKANYYGAVIARVCGRLRNNKISIDSKDYHFQPNNGETFLHGGENAFHTKVFDITGQSSTAVTFTYESKDGEEGFPGNINFKTKYTISEDNELQIKFEAEADQKTPFNVTHHAYFNLNGEGSSDVLDHDLQILTDQYLPIREDILPTGEIASVISTPFDFTTSKKIGHDIDAEHQQINYGSGYDHSFVLSKQFNPNNLKLAAKAVGDLSKIVLEVYTDQPAIHLYTGNFMDESFTLKNAEKDKRRSAFCLETQHLADALNQPTFPCIMLDPHQKFETKTIFKFSIEK